MTYKIDKDAVNVGDEFPIYDSASGQLIITATDVNEIEDGEGLTVGNNCDYLIHCVYELKPWADKNYGVQFHRLDGVNTTSLLYIYIESNSIYHYGGMTYYNGFLYDIAMDVDMAKGTAMVLEAADVLESLSYPEYNHLEGILPPNEVMSGPPAPRAKEY